MKGQKKDSNKKHFRYILMPEKLPTSSIDGKSDENIFPKDPLERCNLRWHCLFWGIWRSLNESDKRYRKIKLGIIEALKKFGLFGVKSFPSELFELNPTDKILRKTLAFRNSPMIPNLRGKKLPWEKSDPAIAIFDYLCVFGALNKPYNDQPLQRIRNPIARKKVVRERLSRIIPVMVYSVSDRIPEELLNECSELPMREMVIRLVAHLHGFKKSGAFRKYLTKGKRNNPSLAQLWEHGIEMIRSQ